MDLRSDPRLHATLIPVQVSGLDALRLEAPARILDVSPKGMRLGIAESIPVGSLLRIELEDSVIFGEVRYCEDRKTWFAVGLYVEQILMGTSPLSRLVSGLLDERSPVGECQPVNELQPEVPRHSGITS
jgi:hypothetical protein